MMVLKSDLLRYILKNGIGRHYKYKLECKKGKFILSTLYDDLKCEVYYSSKMSRLKVVCTYKSGKSRTFTSGEGFECLVDRIESHVHYYITQEEEAKAGILRVANQTPEESAVELQKFIDEYGIDAVNHIYEYGIKHGILRGDGDVAGTFKRFQDQTCAKW